MSCTCEGIEELISKLSALDKNLTNRVAKRSVKMVAEKIKEDMLKVAPVSTERNVHGISAIDVGKIRTSKGYVKTEVGFSTIIGAGSGADYWYVVRGLWFQNYKTDEPNYGWFEKGVRSNKELYREALMELLANEIKPFLNM
jgi:hypothetical protein